MLETLAESIATALGSVATAVGQQVVVEPWFVVNPAAPTIDIYPGDPFATGLAFGDSYELDWTVRARIHTVEHVGAQSVLLALMEPSGATSVTEALNDVEGFGVEGPSGYTEFIDLAASSRHLGVTWRLRVLT